MKKQTYQLELHGYSDTPSSAEVEVVTYTGGERLLRAFGGLGMGWGAGIVCAFIPVAHLFLVPAAFVVGIVLFFLRLRVHRRALQGHGTCPDCGTEQQLDMSGRWHLPQDLECSSCHRGLVLREPA